MNKIPAKIALLGALAAVALTGCTVAGPPDYRFGQNDVAPATSSESLAAPATATHPDKKPDTYLDTVREGWVGDVSTMPDKQWLTTAATLVCKQLINGQDARVALAGAHAAKNEHLIATAAQTFICDAD